MVCLFGAPARARVVVALRLVVIGLITTVAVRCSPSASSPEQRHVASRPQLLRAPAEPQAVAPLIAAELAKARAEHATLLVYVGATWCEPCRRFHDALTAGELDTALPDLRFLEFDYDKSHDALARAGYVSQLIPLFAIPNDDGTASERRIEGSIKGPAAVAQNLVPRLLALLQKASGSSSPSSAR
jgi:thiol-disulfide isomerase/thioredoxin